MELLLIQNTCSTSVAPPALPLSLIFSQRFPTPANQNRVCRGPRFALGYHWFAPAALDSHGAPVHKPKAFRSIPNVLDPVPRWATIGSRLRRLDTRGR